MDETIPAWLRLLLAGASAGVNPMAAGSAMMQGAEMGQRELLEPALGAALLALRDAGLQPRESLLFPSNPGRPEMSREGLGQYLQESAPTGLPALAREVVTSPLSYTALPALRGLGPGLRTAEAMGQTAAAGIPAAMQTAPAWLTRLAQGALGLGGLGFGATQVARAWDWLNDPKPQTPEEQEQAAAARAGKGPAPTAEQQRELQAQRLEARQRLVAWLETLPPEERAIMLAELRPAGALNDIAVPSGLDEQRRRRLLAAQRNWEQQLATWQAQAQQRQLAQQQMPWSRPAPQQSPFL